MYVLSLFPNEILKLFIINGHSCILQVFFDKVYVDSPVYTYDPGRIINLSLFFSLKSVPVEGSVMWPLYLLNTSSMLGPGDRHKSEQSKLFPYPQGTYVLVEAPAASSKKKRHRKK